MRKLILIIPLVIQFAIVGRGIIRSFIKIEKLEKEKKEQIETKQKLQEFVLKYDDKIKHMDNSYNREEIARNKLQMVLPGEKIYRLIEK